MRGKKAEGKWVGNVERDQQIRSKDERKTRRPKSSPTSFGIRFLLHFKVMQMLALTLLLLPSAPHKRKFSPCEMTDESRATFSTMNDFLSEHDFFPFNDSPRQ